MKTVWHPADSINQVSEGGPKPVISGKLVSAWLVYGQEQATGLYDLHVGLTELESNT